MKIDKLLKLKLQEMEVLYDWTPRTYKLYEYTWNDYLRFHNITYQELIDEAETDETKIVKINKRRIKQRLIQYQLHLKEQGLQNSTINTNLSRIKTVYRYEDIEIPDIIKLNRVHHESYKDIPTQEEIKNAIINSNTKMRAIITFLASSGLRRSDMIKLTIDDFITATQEYHAHDDIKSVCKKLENRNDIIPTWNITSQKTHIDHITFNSPEATIYIIQLLKERIDKDDLSDTRLFAIGEKGVTTAFGRLNDRLRYGWNTTRRKFHAHSLRTYFGTTLTNNGLDWLSCEFLLGHKLDPVKQSYYYANPEKLKNKYTRYVDKLTFNMNVEFVDISSKEKRELEMLRSENKETKARLLHLEELVDILNSNILND